jgi:hypothetical protein
VVLLDTPNVIGNAKLICYVPQILMVGDNTGYIAIEFSGLPTGKQIVKTMTHLGYEDGHAWTLIAVVETKLHLIALGIEGGNIFVEFIARNKESLEFPFYSHEEHAIYLVYVLVKIDDVSSVVGDKLSYFRNDTLLVRAV